MPVMISQSALQGVCWGTDGDDGGETRLWLAQITKPSRETVLSDCHCIVSPAFIHTLVGPVLRNE